MLDKNGIEIKAGDVVKIEGGFFKADDGYFFVTHAPGDPMWSGTDCSLCKISKRGKISSGKYRTAFWPIMVTTNSRFKNAEAKAWNEEHATVEVVSDVDRSEVSAYFVCEADAEQEQIENYRRRWRGSSPNEPMMVEYRDFCYSIASNISKEG